MATTVATEPALLCCLLGAAFVQLGATGETGRRLSPCTCDLTPSHCDAHCCCDPDCSAADYSDLKASFDCLPQGPVHSSAYRCYSRSYVHTVNPRADMGAVIVDDLRDLLCVEIDNNMITSIEHTNADRLPTSEIDEARAELQGGSFASAMYAPAPADAERRGGYRVGDILKAHRALSSTGDVLPAVTLDMLEDPQVTEFVTGLTLWTASPYGVCSAPVGMPLRFLVDQPPVTCWLGPLDLRAACGTTLNPAIVTNWLLRAIHLPSDGKCFQRCLAPDLSSSCPIRITTVSGNVEETACAGDVPSVQSVLMETSSGCSCANATRDLHYSLKFGWDETQAALAIKAVHLRMTLQNIESHLCEPVSALQNTSAIFLQEGAADVFGRRSGNPGYQIGFDVLVATCQEVGDRGDCTSWAPDVGVADVGGIRPDGLCTQSGIMYDTPDRSLLVRFGEDAVYGCTLYFTRQQLAEACPAGMLSRLPLLSFGPLGDQGSRWTHVVESGLAQSGPVNPSELVKVETARATEVPTFDQGDASVASTSACSGVVVGVSFELLWSPFGDVSAPQAKVVAARISQLEGALRYTQMDPRSPQPFTFSVSVSFLRVDKTDEPDVRTPPKPQIPLWLPEDLFYPFALSR